MLMTNCRPLSMGSSPCSACMISVNPGRGHGCLLLDCSGIISWGGVAGASVLAVAVDWLSPWAADRDHLGWAQLLWLQLQLQSGKGSHETGSVSLGKLTSIQLDGAMATKTPTSVNKTSGSIAHLSSITLLPDSEVGQGLVVGPSQPNSVTPLHGQWYGLIGWDGSPKNQTSHQQGAWNGTSQLKSVLARGCDHCPPSLLNCTPLALQRRHTPFGQMPGNLHGWGSSWVPSTKVVSPHVWCTTISSPIGIRERALDLWALTLVGVAGCLPPQHQPGIALPHPGVPGGGAPVQGTLQIFLSFDQDGPSLFPWPWPIGLFEGHLLSLPH